MRWPLRRRRAPSRSSVRARSKGSSIASVWAVIAASKAATAMSSSVGGHSLAASDECFRAAVGGGDRGESFGETERVGAAIEGDVGLDEQWSDAESLAHRAASFIDLDTRLE